MASFPEQEIREALCRLPVEGWQRMKIGGRWRMALYSLVPPCLFVDEQIPVQRTEVPVVEFSAEYIGKQQNRAVFEIYATYKGEKRFMSNWTF